MLKKLTLAALFASSAVLAAPAPALADPLDECLLKAGCFLQSDDSGSQWVCSNPRAYMLCLSPDTEAASSEPTLFFKD